ncbi:MAG: hypothetical protein KGI50_02115 [Patescibacteria group bacterium]|nr:hypothetical protein [Patescibacteria group bacterium]MDE2437859.1 hypothetical protein [Patescibacteria group bacterium]
MENFSTEKKGGQLEVLISSILQSTKENSQTSFTAEEDRVFEELEKQLPSATLATKGNYQHDRLVILPSGQIILREAHAIEDFESDEISYHVLTSQKAKERIQASQTKLESRVRKIEEQQQKLSEALKYLL